MAASRSSDDYIGGRYRLEGCIASGGMADVWRATDMQLGREVAVKLLRASVADDPVVAERFRREAKSLAKLTHPNIVPVYDCIEEPDGQVALVMRLIRGQSLRELLDDAGDGHGPGQISTHLTVHIGKAIASALAKAHNENILHRDIKPGNILVMKNGEVLLTDFGIAKPLKASDDDGTDLTRVDIMMGTAKYLSPEQVQGRNLDARADIYSLGLVLYECLAGHVPFKGDNDQATAVARLERDPTPLGGLRADVPSTVINVVHRMLRRRPEHRYANCAEVVEALDEAMRNLHDALTPVEGLSPSLGTHTPRTRPAPLDPLMTPKPPRDFTVGPNDNTPQRAPMPQRDRTPRGTARSKEALPAHRKTNTKRNYVPIALLLAMAAVMSFMLWKGLQGTKSSSVPSVLDNVEIVHVDLAGVKSYDPNGDDGEENDALLPALLDNNPATQWTTVCYGNKYFGSKEGVGIVLQLTGIGLGQLKANFANGPYNADVFVTTSETIPATIGDWGLRVGDVYSNNPGMATVDIKQPARNVLLLLREVGRGTNCSDSNRFKGMINDLSFTSAK
jgi:serine/threonine-protein kinase